MSSRPFIMRRPLWAGFMRTSETFPERPALSAHGKILTYRELRELACRIAATIQSHGEYSATPLPNVVIGRGAVVTAGSVVTQSVPPMTVVQGNPAVPVARCGTPLGRDVTLKEFSRRLKPLVVRVPDSSDPAEIYAKKNP